MSDSEPTTRTAEFKRLKQMARVLDSAITLPGGFRIGLDGMVGLIPGIGDAIGASAATYIVIRAAQMGASTTSLIRMMWNIILEAIVGAVPLLGDLFDFIWKANDKNIALLEKQADRLTGPGDAKKKLTTATLLLLGAFIVVLIGVLALAFWGFLAILQALGG